MLIILDFLLLNAVNNLFLYFPALSGFHILETGFDIKNNS